jgi:hypothetical protein
MTARPRLILHIGTHKTATSTLQALMAKERQNLLAQGFCYPSTTHAVYADQGKHIALSRALVEDDAAFLREYGQLVQEFRASGCHTMVLSEEGLSSPAKLNNNHLQRMKAVVADFDIEVVCFLRRQDYFAESLWNQRCKNGRTKKHIDSFVTQPLVIRHMTYKTMLDEWAVFGTVKAFGFEAACETGIVETFSQATGMTLPAAEKSRNISPGMERAALMAALNAAQIPHDYRQVERVLGADRSRLALGTRHRTALLARFAAHNAELEAAYGVTFPSSLPEGEDSEPIRRPGKPDIRAYQLALMAAGLNAPQEQIRKQARRNRLVQPATAT